MTSLQKDDEFLKQELERLMHLTKYGGKLKVKWTPRFNMSKEGHVLGDTIFIFSLTPKDAIKTLQHEFVDLVLSSVVKIYTDLINQKIRFNEELAYLKKEEAVEMLLRLFSNQDPTTR